MHEANLNFLSLWYTLGRDYGLHDGEWKMTGGAEAANSILVASEPLTRDVASWVEVPEYSVLHARIRDDGRPGRHPALPRLRLRRPCGLAAPPELGGARRLELRRLAIAGREARVGREPGEGAIGAPEGFQQASLHRRAQARGRGPFAEIEGAESRRGDLEQRRGLARPGDRCRAACRAARP